MTPTQYRLDLVLPQGKKTHHLLHHYQRGAHLSVYNDDVKQYNNQLRVIYKYLMNEITDLFTFKEGGNSIGSVRRDHFRDIHNYIHNIYNYIYLFYFTINYITW